MSQRSYKFLGLIGGFLLGLGAPFGSILFKILLFGDRLDPSRLMNEVVENQYFYSYMTATTPIAFMIFGGYLGNLVDRIHSQNESLQNLMSVVQKQSVLDEVTGVFNRRYLFEEIKNEIARSARYGHPLSGMMVDIDHFKDINDRHGHPAGDLILKEISSALLKSVRTIDTVGRYGGDEFIVLMPECKAEGAAAVAERLLRNIRECRIQNQPDLPRVSASIGVVTFANAQHLSPDLFLAAVDGALMRAKSSGKNQIYQAK